ncbi:M48 family metallopeptidase [Halobaculum limi]|uniref:M48 family metallopeptidase n=1 Tax=Halobaculum limi TaxID=3031916 RepID=UPI00240608C7|nr:M48 family metalloprotease [Halobaculum sp. YSMS11]
MALAGAFTIGFYLLATYGVTVVARFLWENRPGLLTLVSMFLIGTLASGYLTYRFGTGRTLVGLDARELPRSHAPEVYDILDSLTARMSLDRPRVFVARLDEPNAFAMGGPHPALVIDYSLFGVLTTEQLEGVLAHELAHIEGRDGLAQTLGYSVVQTVVGLVSIALSPVSFLSGGFARGLALVDGRPGMWHRTLPGRVHVSISQALTLLLLSLTLLLRAYSRRREHAADDRAVEVTGSPLALASALRRLDRASERSVPFAPVYQSDGGSDSRLAQWLSTHPPMDDRIERLQRRAASTESSGADSGSEPDGDTAGGVSPAPRPGRPDRDGDGWTQIPLTDEY